MRLTGLFGRLILSVILITIGLTFTILQDEPFISIVRLFLFGLLLMNFLVLRPITLPTREGEIEGASLYEVFEASSEIGIVVTDMKYEFGKFKQRAFETTSWSLGWVNAFEQEVGRVDLIRPDELSNENISNKRLLILTSSCSALITNKQIQILMNWVHQGRSLLLERPTNRFQILSGITIENYHTPKRVTWCNNDLLDKSLRKVLPEMPLHTSLQKTVNRNDEVCIELKMDDYIAIGSRVLGKGSVITLLFDLGMQLTSLRQGVPDEGFKVIDKRGITGIIDVCDLLVSSKMLDTPVPYADLLQGLIIQIIERRTIIPRLWRCPPSFDGVAIMTHDDDGQGDPCLDLAKWEVGNNYTSTFFIIPSSKITSNTLRIMKQAGFDIQIHWDREPKRCFLIFKHVKSLQSQIKTLSEKINEVPIHACRIHRLRWDKDYSRSFKILVGSGLRTDASMGMCGYTGKGYIFGTGLPYKPLDSKGELISLWEVPFQIQDHYKGADSDYLDSLLINSRNTYHEAICALYHPPRCLKEPTRSQWMNFFDLAGQHNHQITNISRFIKWWESRLAIMFQMQSSKNMIRINYEIIIPNSVGEYGILLPATFNNSLISLIPQEDPALILRNVTLYGKKYTLLTLNQEKGVFLVTYKK